MGSLSSDTPVKTTLAQYWAVIIACVTVAGGAAAYGTSLLRDIRDELKSLNAQVSEQWSVSDQERWAAKLEKSNRSINLSVPEVHEIREQSKSR